MKIILDYIAVGIVILFCSIPLLMVIVYSQGIVIPILLLLAIVGWAMIRVVKKHL